MNLTPHKREMEKIEMDLILNEPFYGSLFRRIRKVFTPGLATFAVYFSSNRIEMAVNPRYFKSLTYKQKKAICKHEMLHICFHHLLRYQLTGISNHKLHNIACDLSINQRLKGLPPDGLTIPKVFRTESSSIEKNREAEYYYKELLKRIRILKKEKKSFKTLDIHDYWEKGQPETEEELNAISDRQESGNSKEPHNTPPQEQDFSTGAAPPLPESVTAVPGAKHAPLDVDKEVLVRALIEQAASECQNKLPSDLKGTILRGLDDMKDFTHKKRWYEFLREYIQNLMNSLSFRHYRIQPNKKRPCKKRGFPYPSLRVHYTGTPHVAVCIDASGSIDNDTFKRFIHEVNCMYDREIRITLIGFDEIVHEKNIIPHYSPRLRKDTAATGFLSIFPEPLGGGTCFGPAITAAETLLPKPDCIVMYTDSYNFDEITKPETPIVFVLTEMRQNFYPWAETIYMDEVEKGSFVSIRSSEE